MKKPITIAYNKNCKAIDLGPFSELSSYEFLHPLFKKVDKGRIFTGEYLESTGAEISFRELPPNTKIPFLHKHHKHEEIYIFLKGHGQFQVDNDVFDVREGSLVRVSPDGNRTLCNCADEVMVYMVVQSSAGSLAAYNVKDGYRSEGDVKLY